MTRDPGDLLDRLGCRFEDPALLEAALTHRSARGQNNERLEFLGDAVLGFIVSAWLYAESPEADEGELSRLRASLVKKGTLAEIGAGLGLGDFLRLGGGELKSGGFRRASILADALEAVIGALYLDSGLEEARKLVERLFAGRVRDVLAAGVQKDAKTMLQEYLQAEGTPLPEYTVSSVRGKSHEHVFTVQCEGGDPPRVAEGQGPSRRRAEQMAASRLLEQLRGE